MRGFFLRIYDFLVGRRWVAVASIVLLTLVCAALALRMEYAEDISAFLPSNPENARYSEVYEAMGAKDNLIILFRPGEGTDSYAVEDAMDGFETKWAEADTVGLITRRQLRADDGAAYGMADFIAANWPYFLTEEDYARADSLLADRDYVRRTLEADYQVLAFPAGDLVTRNLRSDPLRLFTPVLSRLRSGSAQGSYSVRDGYLFTADGVGVGFMTSPYGTSESGKNAEVARMIAAVEGLVEAGHPGVSVSAVGAPLIAVSNASQIKRDSAAAICVAAVLICLLLIVTYRKLSYIAWLAASTAFGWVVAVALLAAFSGSMSIIVLGIGSIIIGIAINYPLHYVDGLLAGIPSRQNLADMVSPLLIGNITTVAAFLCLVFLDAEALRDLGLFWSLLLVGTILFTLVPLPVLLRGTGAPGRRFEVGKVLPDKVPDSGWLFGAVALASAVMFFLSRRAEFDSSLQDINYMTAAQRADMALLSGSQEREGMVLTYVVAEADSLDAALRRNEGIQAALSGLEGVEVKGIGSFVPSREAQRQAIDRWNGFWDGRAEELLPRLREEALAAGFSESAFEPFFELFSRDWRPQGGEGFRSVAAAFDGTYMLRVGERHCVVTQVYAPGEVEVGKIVAATADGAATAFAFTASDVGNGLADTLHGSFDYIVSVCSAVVFLFLLFSFRRLEISILAFLPLAVGWWWILGVMHLAGLQFNIVNVILATFIFGQGDDYTIFTTEGLIYEYAYGRRRFAAYKNSIVHSALIMFIGIGALILAKHPAMRSLAEVTVIGMLVVVLLAWYLPPVIFRWLTTKGGKPRDVPITMGRLLRSAYAYVAFLVAMFLFVYPVTFFWFLFGGRTEGSKLRYHVFLQKTARFFMTHVPGAPLRLRGDLSALDRPAFVICNHQSQFDSLCLMLLSPRIVFLTNDWVWRNPFYSYVLRKAEFYPVSDGLEKNAERIRELVGRGWSVAVAPEGTRSADCSIGRFHKGVFYMAETLGLDIVPVYIHGAGHVLPKHELILRKGHIFVEVGGREAPVGDYHDATKLWRRRYIERYDDLRRELETPEYLAKYVRCKYFYKGATVEAASRRALSGLAYARWLHWDAEALRGMAASGENGAGVGVADGALPQVSRGGDGFAGVAHRLDGGLEVRGCGQGELAWIYALMHPDVEVYASDADEDSIAVALHCSNRPRNLHFSVAAASVADADEAHARMPDSVAGTSCASGSADAGHRCAVAASEPMPGGERLGEAGSCGRSWAGADADEAQAREAEGCKEV